MLMKDFKKGRAARTAARRAGHLARITGRWEGHTPPAVILNPEPPSCTKVLEPK